MEKGRGLYPNYLNPRSGRWGAQHTSVGALGDSFYEYLLKVWIWSGGTDKTSKTMFDDAIAAINKNLVFKGKSGLTYLAQLKKGRVLHQMDHLACFMGGLYALAAPHSSNSTHFMEMAKGITNTCHETYIRTQTHLGPESFHFATNGDGSRDGRAIRTAERAYFLRPETVESYFILWRTTKDPKYRDWGWDVVQVSAEIRLLETE